MGASMLLNLIAHQTALKVEGCYLGKKQSKAVLFALLLKIILIMVYVEL